MYGWAQDQALDHARQEFHSGRIQLLPQLVAEKPLVQEEEHLRGQMPEQCGDHRPFTAVDVLENQADFDVGSQFDQTELAHLGKGPIAARPGRRASKGGVIGWRVGNVIDGAVDAHQAEPAVKRPGSSRLGQRAGNLGEQLTHGSHAQPLTCDAEAGSIGRLFTLPQPPGMFEDLADRQVCEQPHGEHDPQDDLVGQQTLSRIDTASGHQRLLNVLGPDNLFQTRQSIQNPACVISRQRTSSLMHVNHSLHVTWVQSKPKVT